MELNHLQKNHALENYLDFHPPNEQAYEDANLSTQNMTIYCKIMILK